MFLQLKAEKWYLGLLLLAILASVWPVFLGRFYATGDMRDVFIPIEQFYHQQLLQGRLPAWQPDAAWGFPVIAAAQIGFFYPPLLLLRIFPLWLYLPVTLVVHAVALGLGMYLFLRRLNQSAPAAWIGSLSFTLSAFVVQHITHLNITLIVAWLPWQLLAATALAKHKELNARRVVWYVLCTAMPFLVGQLQVPLMLALFSSLYFIYLYQRSHGIFIRLLVFVGVFALLVMAVAACQLLPTLELVQYSSRGASGDFDVVTANQHSYPVYHLPALLFPRFFGTDATYWGKRLEIEYGFYIGTLPLFFALFAIGTRRRRYAFWIWVLVLSFLLALGNFSPFRLVGIEPSLWYFSAPARWLLFATLALSVLSGFGWDTARQKKNLFLKFAWPYTAFVVLTIVGFNFALAYREPLLSIFREWLTQTQPDFFSARPPVYYAEKFGQLAESLRLSGASLLSGYTLLPLIVVLASPYLFARRYGSKLLLFICAVELVIVAGTTTPTVPWKTLVGEPRSVSVLPELVRTKQARLYSKPSADGDTGAFLTNPQSRASAAVRASQKEALVPLLNAQFNIPGVAWPASLDFQAQSTALGELAGNHSDRDSDAQMLNIGAIVEVGDNSGIIVNPLTPAPRASIVQDNGSKSAVTYPANSPGKLEFVIDTSSNSELLIRDSWYPAWSAQVNGQGVAVERVEPFFMKVRLPSGHSIVTLSFQSWTLYSGIIISLLTCIILAGVYMYPHFRKTPI